MPGLNDASCTACGCKMNWDDVDEYRIGYWCSRACAYDMSN